MVSYSPGMAHFMVLGTPRSVGSLKCIAPCGRQGHLEIASAGDFEYLPCDVIRERGSQQKHGTRCLFWSAWTPQWNRLCSHLAHLVRDAQRNFLSFTLQLFGTLFGGGHARLDEAEADTVDLH